MLRPFIALCIAACFTISLMAQPAPPAGQSIADQLAEDMAIAEQLQELPDDILLQFEQNPLQLPAQKNERMLQLFQQAYAKDLLLDDFTNTLSPKITSEYNSTIKGWLNKENIQTVAGARQEFYTLQGKRKRIITMYEINQQPTNASRDDLIAALAESGSTAESSIESSVTILRSVIEGLNQLSTQRNFSAAQIDAIANNFRAQIQPQVSQQIMQQLMVTYHSVDSKAIEDYINFWQTDTGQWLDATIAESIEETYRIAGDRFLQAINSEK